MITIQHVSKRYHNVDALTDVSLEIPQGAVYGLLGPNGAGKTTLLRILAALIFPSKGQVWIEGEEISAVPDRIRSKVGYMPDFFGVYPDLTTVEYLHFYAGLHRIPLRKRTALINDLLEIVDLTQKRDVLVETLSRGMKQRLCLARALLHDPPILLLDEPASGLDPNARVELRELLRALQDMGKTIIVSSHILRELEDMCTHVAVLQDGRLAFSGAVTSDTDGQERVRRLEIRVLDRAEVAAQLLRDMPEITNVALEQPDEAASLLVAHVSGDDQALHHVLRALLAHEIPVVSYAQSPMNRIEEIFTQSIEGTYLS